MISERQQGKLPELAPDATDAQRSERADEERQRDSDFIAETLARTADSLNAQEHVAVAAHLKTIFTAVRNQAHAIAALESAAKPA